MATSSETTDPLPRIAEALGDIAGRLTALSEELRALPVTAEKVPVSPTEPAPEPEPEPEPAPASTLPPPPPPPPAPLPPPPMFYPQQQWQPRYPAAPTLTEKLGKDGAGSKVLAWIGGAVTLLGVVLLLVLAIQRGWLGPVPRVVLGAALGGTLTGIGVWLHRTPSARTGAFALAATGIAVLYIDLVAATTLLDLVPSWAGLLLGLVIAIGGLALAGYWQAQGLAVFVLLGCALLAPILTSGFTAELLVFLLILLLAAIPVQLGRSWPGLVLAAGLPPLLSAMTAVVTLSLFDQKPLVIASLAALLSVLVLAASTATLLRHREDVSPIALIAVAPLPVMLLPIQLDRLPASAFTGGLAILFAALALIGGKRLPSGTATASGLLASLLLLETTLVFTGGDARPIVLLAEAAALAGAATRIRNKTLLGVAGGFGGIGLLLSMATAASPLMLLRGSRSADAGALLTSAAASLLIAVTAGLLCAAALSTVKTKELVLVPGGGALLYGAAGVVLYPTELLVPGELGFLVGHALITVSWTVAALVLLIRGIDRRGLRVTGLILVGAALAKLVLFDLASLDGMARVGAFLGAGLVLLAAGTRYAKLVGANRPAENHSSGPMRM